jgi:hypothetical protein
VSKVGRAVPPAALFILLTAPFAHAAEPLPTLVTACEALHAPSSYDHKPVLIAGRISKRGNRRYIGEDTCELAIQFDPAHGPLPPDSFGVSATEAKRKFNAIAQHTVLHEFRLGTGAYDRWAMVLGRLDMESPPPKTDDTNAPPGTVVGEILCRGEALIFLWAGD